MVYIPSSKKPSPPEDELYVRTFHPEATEEPEHSHDDPARHPALHGPIVRENSWIHIRDETGIILGSGINEKYAWWATATNLYKRAVAGTKDSSC